jgi:hypothetical protein
MNLSRDRFAGSQEEGLRGGGAMVVRAVPSDKISCKINMI